MIWLIILIVFLAVFIFFAMRSAITFRKDIRQTKPEFIIDVIKDKIADQDVAMSMSIQGENWLSVHEKELFPLPGTIKVIIAIEYAIQVAEKRIDPKEKVSIQTLETFNIPKTDGKAHKEWLTSLNKTEDYVTLDEIAHGMIYYSSNANTDYLIQRLGIENINQVPKWFGIEDHEPIFPIVSSLYIPVHIMREEKKKKQQLIWRLREMDMEEYRDLAIEIHQKWQEQPPSFFDKQQVARLLNFPVQLNWSERLPKSTSEAYETIMRKLNDRTVLSAEVHKYLDPILRNSIRKSSAYKEFTHLGRNAGYTVNSVAWVLYATDTSGQKISLALFLRELNPVERTKVTYVLNEFQQRFLTDASFREHFKTEVLSTFSE